MYNGIGLTTPRGSGTNGYVIRNLSTLRSHEPNKDRQSAWDVAPPKHREPDQEILEHERKRGVEVKCLELQLKLEDDELDEGEIEQQVDALRQKLLEQLNAFNPSAKSLKASDTHAIAAAKKAELDKMARALGTRPDYTEGDAFDREKQEENKMKRAVEREEKDQQREETRSKMLEQKTKWEAEKREKDRLRRREEDKRRRQMPPPTAPRDRVYRRRTPPPRTSPRRDSRSPPPPRRRRFESRSPSRSRSPPRYRRDSPRRRDSRDSPPRKMSKRSPSPRGRARSRSVASGSSMSVSSGSRSRSP